LLARAEHVAQNPPIWWASYRRRMQETRRRTVPSGLENAFFSTGFVPSVSGIDSEIPQQTEVCA
jgi:hypothetical protein